MTKLFQRSILVVFKNNRESSVPSFFRVTVQRFISQITTYVWYHINIHPRAETDDFLSILSVILLNFSPARKLGMMPAFHSRMNEVPDVERATILWP